MQSILWSCLRLSEEANSSHKIKTIQHVLDPPKIQESIFAFFVKHRNSLNCEER